VTWCSTDESKIASRLPSSKIGRAMSPTSNVRLSRAYAARARATISGSASTPTTSSSGYSAASASLQAPEPHPMSATTPSHSTCAAVSATFWRMEASMPER